MIARGCDTDIPSFRDHAWMVSKILLSRSTYYTGDNSSPNFTNWSLSICYYLLPMDRVPTRTTRVLLQLLYGETG